jgi:very-short-patch-repair endonuclease
VGALETVEQQAATSQVSPSTQYRSLRVDFYCPIARLVIEIDGPTHFMPGAQEYDRQRQDYIESYGISFLRFTNDEVYQNILEVVAAIHEKILSPS